MSARQIPRSVFSIDVLLTVLTISGILYICWDDEDIGRFKVAKWNGSPKLRDIQQKNHNSPNDLIHITVCPNGWKHGTTVFGSHNTSTPVCVSSDRNHQRVCMPSIGYEIKKNVVPLCESRSEEQISLLVFDDLKLIFITIPFTDGRILRKNLPAASNANNTVLKLDESNISFLHNMTSHFPGYRKFTMVRHPCTRLIAAWKFEEKFTLDSSTTSFESFIEGLLLNKNKETENGDRFQSQIEILFDEDEQFTLDRLLLFETWHQSVNILKTVLMEGKSNSEMIFEPQSKYNDCKVMYTPKTWKTMTSYFAMDFCVLGYPHNMTEIDEVPRVAFTKQTLASRIKQCRQEHTNELGVGNESLLSQLNATDEDKRCTIYTYFQKSSRASNTTANENDNMLAVWKNTWSSAGWIPRIISEEEATKHPKYNYFREQYMKLPTVNPKEYELACFMRYVAMAVVGGGWMSDYDVLPVNIQPCSSPWHNGSFTVYGRVVPALVSGTKEEYDRVAMLMANISWEVSAIFKTEDGRPHVSDMICIVDFIKRGFLISEDTLISANKVFKVPFECSNSAMKQTSSVQELDNGNSSTLPMGIHYSHASLNVLKGFLSEYLTGDKIQESNQHRFNLMANFHDFYVRKCI